MKLVGRILLICALRDVCAFSQPRPQAGPSPINYETARLDKIVTAIRISEKITLDGHLEEPAWQQAVPAADFTQWARPGVPATNKTEVRFLYDDDNLYVGFDCWDKDIQHAVINELRKDFSIRDSDGVTLIIDSRHDRSSGFLFATSPVGARRDTQLANDGASNNQDWDGVWEVKTSIDDRGWIAEYRIPFKTLRFSDDPIQEWGVNMGRRTLGIAEEDMWAPVPIRFVCCTKPSLAGSLRGIENIHPGRNLTAKPFFTSGITDVRNGSQMQRTRSLGNIHDYQGGVDGKYGLTKSLTLDMTYHTDFAQVEADQQQINLTRFSLFFPEKRDFFLENSGTFTFGPPANAGGQATNLVPFFSRQIGLSSSGTPIPIVGGARLTGKAARYDLGFLAMKTEQLDTPTSSVPSNNYLVGRVKRNLLTRSWVGMLVTNRDSTRPGDYNRVYGPDAHFVFHDKLEIDSYLLQSDTPGKSGRNQARRFETGWRDNEWLVTGEYNQVQTNFNPEVGFIRRKDNSQYVGNLAYKPLFRKSPTIRDLNFAGNVEYFKGGNGKIETRSQELTMGIDFRNNAAASFTVTQTFDRLANGIKIQRLSIPIGDYNYLGYNAKFNSDTSEKISGSGSLDWGEFWNGHWRSATGGLNVKPMFRFVATFNYTRNLVNLPNGSSTTDLAGARFVYAFSPRAFMNAFFQYNSETHEVSTNLRFNITYRPLSDVYLVYNDRRSAFGNELMERAFIVKVTNLLNF